MFKRIIARAKRRTECDATTRCSPHLH
jgi:hypothetical protein